MPRIVDDQQGYGGEIGKVVLTGAVQRGIRELFEQHEGFAIAHLVALLDRGMPDGLRQMALARAWRAEEERVLALGDESGRWPARR